MNQRFIMDSYTVVHNEHGTDRLSSAQEHFMHKRTHIAAFLLGATFLASPLAWAQNDTATENQGKTLSTQEVKENNIDRSDWIGFDEATKKLKDAGYGDIILLKQTGKGYFARTRDDEGNFRHIYIDPKGEMDIKKQYTQGNRRGGQHFHGERGPRKGHHSHHQRRHQQHHQQ